MLKRSFVRWRANFFTGLAVILPAFLSIVIFIWLFDRISNVTDKLLFVLPKHWTRQDGGMGDPYSYWSLVSILITVLLITFVGRLTRNYLGKKLIQVVDVVLLRVPLLNKIYSTLKQVNEAFSSNKRSAFQQVLLVEFPRLGQFSVGFLTSDHHPEIAAKAQEPMVSVFVPTTPNPTTGFLLIVPQHSVRRLDMSVAEGIKYIISLGAVSPEYGARLQRGEITPTPPDLDAQPIPAPTPLTLSEDPLPRP